MNEKCNWPSKVQETSWNPYFFGSSKSGDKLISLDQYIVRMKPGQKQIYYITGQDKKQLEKSPLLENLLKRGYEILEISIVLVIV